MKKYTLKTALHLSNEDKEILILLPDNLPDTKLTKKQIQQVDDLYYTYISKNGIFYGWSRELFELELSEKWPSGPRVKRHEAKRFILSNLLELNEYRKSLTMEQAASKFYNSLTCRESYTILLSKAFELV